VTGNDSEAMSAGTEPARVLLRPPAVQAGLVNPAPIILFMRRLARRRTALFGLVVVMLVVVSSVPTISAGTSWLA